MNVHQPRPPDDDPLNSRSPQARAAALDKLFGPREQAIFERGKIQHEDELVNHRLSWLTTSQAIFVTAYVLGFTDRNTIPTALHVGIPILALCTCALFSLGIMSAIRASQVIEKQWDTYHADHVGVLMAGTPLTRRYGLLCASLVAPVFIATWLGALIYEALDLI